MKKENIKELTDKELQDRLDQVQKEYVQEKIQHTISPLDNPAKITQLGLFPATRVTRPSL